MAQAVQSSYGFFRSNRGDGGIYVMQGNRIFHVPESVFARAWNDETERLVPRGNDDIDSYRNRLAQAGRLLSSGVEAAQLYLQEQMKQYGITQEQYNALPIVNHLLLTQGETRIEDVDLVTIQNILP